MYKKRKIGVVIPCFNEAKQIGKVIETMPDFVDAMIVVDDCSRDNTLDAVKKLQKNSKRKIEIIEHKENSGVGAAISSGYIWCRENDIDIAVVMAGDAQMDPDDLPSLIDPVADGIADYAKGNRFITGEAFEKIPIVRYFGNSVLTLMTKVASGYWHVTDSQSGYTALGRRALNLLPIEKIYPRYGMPNDFLVTLNIYDMKVIDIPVNPLYGVGEKSSMVVHLAIPSLLYLMTRLFIKRMLRKYIIRDFHPLIFFYMTALILTLIATPLTARILYLWLYLNQSIRPINALGTGFTIIMALQFLLFAMWFDMDYNRNLNPHR
jgi:glycosyltransferase involved in cell wall biosynthesis